MRVRDGLSARQAYYMHMPDSLEAVTFRSIQLKLPAGYKAYSHNRALRGCRQLLASMQDSGGTSAAASSQGTHALAEAAPDDASTAKETPHSTAAGSSLDATGEASGAGQSERPALVHLMSDEELVRIVRTHQRCVLQLKICWACKWS